MSTKLKRCEYINLVSSAMQGLLSNPSYMKEYKGEKYLLEENIIAKVSVSIAKAVEKEILKSNNSNRNPCGSKC